MASSSSHTTLNYHVFLSFRGSDTRRTFVSHLYKALDNRGILTFKDDRELENGDSITEELRRAIRSSRFAIVVISENYAFSRWCLEELQLIMELQLGGDLTVFPIFYGVKPSDVRHKKGNFADSFQKHERREQPERLSKWREALTRFADLSGVESTERKDEAAMIDEIIEDISSRLPSMQPLDFSNIVGMNDEMARISPLLEINSDEVRMIGIWGMGGIGKTTIAKYLFEEHKPSFSPHYCFMENVAKLTKEHGLLYLQKQLLSNVFRQKNMKLESLEQGRQQVELRLKDLKVFLVLDGVDEVSQVDELAKNTSWFGRGSRIIITTRDRGLLKACRVDNVHEAKCLNDDHSLQMFKQIAFEGVHPHVYEEFAVRASQLGQGLPSAIEAFSLYLRGKTTMEEWRSSLNRLERNPPKNVMKILKLSYNGLEEPDKNIFLHIVFLFNGSTVRRVTTLLDDDEESETNLGIKILVDKSLISVSADGYISMHALVEQMGREVIHLESERESWRRRFLQDPREICRVLSQETGHEQTQSIILHMCAMPRHLTIKPNFFESMPNLKFLKFYKHLDIIAPNLQVGSVDNVLPDKLRLLHWDACLLRALPSESVKIQCLVEVNLRYSNLNNLGVTDTEVPGFANLRRLDLTGSDRMQKLSGLSSAKKLEELVISGCTRLNEIPLSHFRCLRKLSVGHLNGTTTITDGLPEVGNWILTNAHARLYHLTDLSITGTISIFVLGLQGNADSLSFSSSPQIHDQLMTTGQETTTPQIISDSHGFKAPDIESLDIKRFDYELDRKYSFGCYSFSRFPSLRELSLINLNIQEIPSDIGDLQSLEKLDLSGNNFVSLPTAIGQQAKLKYLSLSNCRQLKSLPQLPQLERLTLLDCVDLHSMLEEIPGLEKHPRSYQLVELCLENCKTVELLSYELSHFTKLTFLDLSCHDFKTLPSSIRYLSSLVTLNLNNCRKLISILELPRSLKYLSAIGSDELKIVTLYSDHSVKHLDLSHCIRLNQIEELMTRFLNNQHNESVSPRFACLPISKKSTFFNKELPMIVGLNVWVIVASNFHLQFPMLSYTWSWETNSKFSITLKPVFLHPLAGICYQLVFIHFPSSVNSQVPDPDDLKFEAQIECPEDLLADGWKSTAQLPQAYVFSRGGSLIRES